MMHGPCDAAGAGDGVPNAGRAGERVLLLDAHAAARRALAAELEARGLAVVQAGDAREAWLRFLRASPDVVVAEAQLAGCDGPDWVERVRTRSDVPVIVSSARLSAGSMLRWLRAGADEVFALSEIGIEQLVDRIVCAAAGRRAPAAPPELEQRLVGSSASMARVRARVQGLAPLGTPVLVVGEPGTGRDAVVRALHDLGASAGGPLHVVDCARDGADEDPAPGCSAVYLDGVESLAPAAQSVWSARLRAWETARGEAAPRVFASAHPLFRVPAQLAFDEGLRARLARFPLPLPTLAERRDDVPALAAALVRRSAERIDRRIALTTAAGHWLGERAWPGNVTQLAGLLERAVAFSRERLIDAGMLRELVGDLEDSLDVIRRQGGLREREDLLDALQVTGGNVSRAAERLGRSRGAVYRMMARYGISLNAHR